MRVVNKQDDKTRAAAKRELETSREHTREQAIEKLRKLRHPFPPGFKFDGDEANTR